MTRQRSFQLFSAMFALALTGAFLLFELARDQIFPGRADADLSVHFLDVGQGDASLIRTPGGKNILIDGGPGRAVLEPLGRSLPWHERTVDLMVLTHPHDDHVSGLIAVMESYQVGKILYTGVVHTAPAYLEWLGQVRGRGIETIVVSRPQTIVLEDDCRLEILYPLDDRSGLEPASLNNSSIVVRLVYGETAFLFMGDAEAEAERALAASGADLTADVIKAGHHGSNTSSGAELISLARPAYAVISAGADNKFGHPSLRVLRRYERSGAKVYRTDLDSTVSFYSDGQRLLREKFGGLVPPLE